MSRTTERLTLLVILALYAVLVTLYALRTPRWQAPDEPAHYNYVAQLSAAGCCPIIETGDWDQAYLSDLTANRFPPELTERLDQVQYEDHQPPLYYLLGALPYRAALSLNADTLLALRLTSALWGLGAVLCAYAVGKQLAPRQPSIALTAAGLTAFIPQQLSILASVNNDALAEFAAGLTLLALIRALKTGRARDCLIVGGLVGVGFLTKTTIYLLAGVVPLALLIAWARESPRSLRTLIGRWLSFALPAVLIGVVWWARNLAVYGVPDFLGLGRHDAVVIGQLRTADYIAQVGMEAYLRSAAATTFNSFWGQFGWMAAPLPEWIYSVIALALLIALVGGLLALRRVGRLSAWQTGAWAALGLMIAFTGLQFAYYNTAFVQFQGRYWYPALIPLTLLFAYGIDSWRRLFLDRAGTGRMTWLTTVVPLLLVPLNLWVVWRVLPTLAP